ncbi:hypothetical protein [Jiella pelagia]|uniref:Oxidoreductase molybdopterin-binding domain-containing protein n=1 Tax=Jiella pelagia TaxID=2986949 RepID=A0ABY7BV13_9HYPH|nr:hypothetical protein [Jiella pelagia]WAP67163.1 hypothetical protein OH818_16370 [Jiella pelagia]
MAITRRTFLRACALPVLAGPVLAGVVAPARASTSLDDPERPVLAVSRNGERLAALSRSDLAAMPQTRLFTQTPWNNEPVEYEGPSVGVFLSRFSGEEEESLRLLALNDYLVTAKAGMLIEAGAILAVKENGAFMPTSSKGPVFVMFPFDAEPRLQSQRYYSRAVWQLVAIELT